MSEPAARNRNLRSARQEVWRCLSLIQVMREFGSPRGWNYGKAVAVGRHDLSCLPEKRESEAKKNKNQTTWKHGEILFQTQVVNMYLWVLEPTAITGSVQIIALCVPHTCAPFFQSEPESQRFDGFFFVLPGAESDVWGNKRASLVANWTWWMPGQTDQALNFLFIFSQSLLHFENSDMGWGAAHTQECRWVETGSDTHAREVSFHPLAVVRWGGSTPNQRGGNLTPSQTATCTAFQLIQPQNFTLVLKED